MQARTQNNIGLGWGERAPVILRPDGLLQARLAPSRRTCDPVLLYTFFSISSNDLVRKALSASVSFFVRSSTLPGGQEKGAGQHQEGKAGPCTNDS